MAYHPAPPLAVSESEAEALRAMARAGAGYLAGYSGAIKGVMRLGSEDAKHAAIKDYAYLLPEGIREFTTKCVYDMAENKHLSFIQGK